jgi:Flp pilus assembly protein TadD
MDFELEQKRIEELLREGWQQLASDDYEAALAAFESALMIDSQNAAAASLAAICLARLGRAKEAEPLARLGCQLAPEAAIARAVLAEALSAQNRYVEAESELIDAIALEPYNPDAHMEFSQFLLTQGRVEEAAAALERAGTLNPDEPQLLLMLGLVYCRLGRFEGAERSIERALELAPKDDGALICYGLMWSERSGAAKRLRQKLKFLRRAAQSFERALKLNPANQLAKQKLHMARSQIKRAKMRYWQLATLFLLGALALGAELGGEIPSALLAVVAVASLLIYARRAGNIFQD